MYGWRGKVLRVDLGSGKAREEPLDPQVARDYVGGRGLGMYYLLREVDALCDPLGDENPLIMAVSPLTGTRAPTGARYMVVTKSPLTGAVTCSNSGGHFPAEMKRAGLDMIIIEGKAREPVYLWIDGGRGGARSGAPKRGVGPHPPPPPPVVGGRRPAPALQTRFQPPC